MPRSYYDLFFLLRLLKPDLLKPAVDIKAIVASLIV